MQKQRSGEPAVFDAFPIVGLRQRAARDFEGIAARAMRPRIRGEQLGGQFFCAPAGDFSDVKVVTPAGEIPWSRLSRMRNDEIREFMKQVVDRLYTVLLRLDDPEFVGRMDQYARRSARAWDEPKNLPDCFI